MLFKNLHNYSYKFIDRASMILFLEDVYFPPEER